MASAGVVRRRAVHGQRAFDAAVEEVGDDPAGVDAFVALWRATPGFRWLAAVVGLPGVRQVAGVIYERVLAPLLYRLHLRRSRALTSRRPPPHR